MAQLADRPAHRAANTAAGRDRDAPLTPDNRRGNWARGWGRVYISLTSPAWAHFSDNERARRCRLSPAHFNRVKHSPEMSEAIRLHATNGLTSESTKLAEHIKFNAALPGKDGDKSREIWSKAAKLIADGRERSTADRALDIAADLAAGLARAHSAGQLSQDSGPPMIEHVPSGPMPDRQRDEAARAKIGITSEPAEGAKTALTDW